MSAFIDVCKRIKGTLCRSFLKLDEPLQNKNEGEDVLVENYEPRVVPVRLPTDLTPLGRLYW